MRKYAFTAPSLMASANIGCPRVRLVGPMPQPPRLAPIPPRAPSRSGKRCSPIAATKTSTNARTSAASPITTPGPSTPAEQLRGFADHTDALAMLERLEQETANFVQLSQRRHVVGAVRHVHRVVEHRRRGLRRFVYRHECAVRRGNSAQSQGDHVRMRTPALESGFNAL